MKIPVSDPLERIAWLRQERERILAEIDEEFAKSYFRARLQGQIEQAIEIGPYSKKVVLKMTRQQNALRGTQIRWRDGYRF